MSCWGFLNEQLCLLYYYCPVTTPRSLETSEEFWSLWFIKLLVISFGWGQISYTLPEGVFYLSPSVECLSDFMALFDTTSQVPTRSPKQGSTKETEESIIKGTLINPHVVVMRHLPTPSGCTLTDVGFLGSWQTQVQGLILQLYGTTTSQLKTDATSASTWTSSGFKDRDATWVRLSPWLPHLF